MSGSHYNISYCQILESERKLQLSNLLKFLYFEQAGSDTICLKEYLKSFADDKVEERHLEIDLEPFTDELLNITSPVLDNSQIECLNYVAGYAVFAYFKQSSEWFVCHNFLTSPKDIQIENDTGFSLIDQFDRCSYLYPSENVYRSVITMYEIFIKIDNHPNLCSQF